MSKKCFCHFNGYEVKDADARKRLDTIEQDYEIENMNGLYNYMTGLAENPENDGKVYGIKDEQIVAMDAPAGGGTTIRTFNSVEEMNAANLPDGTIALVKVTE